MQSQKMLRAAYIIFLPLLMALSGASRSSVPEKFNPVTHGGLGGSTVTCEATYGLLPCTAEVWGQIFLIVVYEFFLSLGEQYVSAGSRLFFRMFRTGIFGASLFQILGSLMILGNSSSFPLRHLYFFLYTLKQPTWDVIISYFPVEVFTFCPRIFFPFIQNQSLH